MKKTTTEPCTQTVLRDDGKALKVRTRLKAGLKLDFAGGGQG